MTIYKLKDGVTKEILLKNGFKYGGNNILKLVIPLYDKIYNLHISVYLDGESMRMDTEVRDSYTGQIFTALYNKYGRNKVRDETQFKYEVFMGKLAQKGLIERDKGEEHID